MSHFHAMAPMRFCEACDQPIDADPPKPLILNGFRLEGREISFDGRRAKLFAGGCVVLMRRLMLFGRISHEAFEYLQESEGMRPQAGTYACHLRKALKQIHAPLALKTIWGWGFELVDLDGNPIDVRGNGGAQIHAMAAAHG